jgi:hypothetical protein
MQSHPSDFKSSCGPGRLHRVRTGACNNRNFLGQISEREFQSTNTFLKSVYPGYIYSQKYCLMFIIKDVVC